MTQTPSLTSVVFAEEPRSTQNLAGQKQEQIERLIKLADEAVHSGNPVLLESVLTSFLNWDLPPNELKEKTKPWRDMKNAFEHVFDALLEVDPRRAVETLITRFGNSGELLVNLGFYADTLAPRATLILAASEEDRELTHRAIGLCLQHLYRDLVTTIGSDNAPKERYLLARQVAGTLKALGQHEPYRAEVTSLARTMISDLMQNGAPAGYIAIFRDITAAEPKPRDADLNARLTGRGGERDRRHES